MNKTVKIAVSMPAAAFKKLEALRRRTGKSRSRVVREALAAAETHLAGRPRIEEKHATYETPRQGGRVDRAERRRKAIAAAGRFRSGLPDLAENHDRYLDEIYAETSAGKSSGRKD